MHSTVRLVVTHPMLSPTRPLFDEDYSDFDSEVIGKVAGIYKVSDAVAIRGSFGTGFRAPTWPARYD